MSGQDCTLQIDPRAGKRPAAPIYLNAHAQLKLKSCNCEISSVQDNVHGRNAGRSQCVVR